MPAQRHVGDVGAGAGRTGRTAAPCGRPRSRGRDPPASSSEPSWTHSTTSRRGGSHSRIGRRLPVCSPSSCVIANVPVPPARALALVAADPAGQPVGLGQRRPDVLDRVGPGPAELQPLPAVVLAGDGRRAGCRGPRSWRGLRSLVPAVRGRSRCPVRPAAGPTGRGRAPASRRAPAAAAGRARTGAACPRCATATRPASRSTRRCRLIAGRLTGNRPASSPAASSPPREQVHQLPPDRVGQCRQRLHGLCVTHRLRVRQGSPQSDRGMRPA